MRRTPLTLPLATAFVAAALAAGVLVASPSSAAAQTSWTISETTPCVGLTARWAVPEEQLDAWLVPGRSPALSPDGLGTLALFALSCPASTIDSVETGRVTSAHVIIPLAAAPGLPTVPEVDDDAWIAVPWTIGSYGNPVTDLFGRFAFATSPADISFTFHPGSDGSPAGARFKLTGDGGEIDVAAQFDTRPTPMGRTIGLIDARDRPMDMLFAYGPETASRYDGGRGRVTIAGETVLSGLDLDPAQARFSLDVDFTWDFLFVSGAAR